MNRIKYGILFLVVLIFAGCANQNTKKEEELRAAVRAELRTEKEIKEEQEHKNIRDIKAVIEFVNDSNTNRMVDQNGEKMKVFENYEAHYFDFTGEGNEDVAIVTWDEANIYLPVIFVTADIFQNEYYLINSDFRGNEGDIFFSEGNFIIKDDKNNQSYDIAYNDGNEYVNMVTRYISYGAITQVLQPEIDIQYSIEYTLEKIDGFKQFNLHSTYTYFDEKGKKHKYDDMTRTYTFNKEKKEYNTTETNRMERIPLEKLVAQNFVVGSDDSLQSFETVYNKSDLETAINYYYEHRTQFSKKARIEYVKQYEELINNIIPRIQDEILSKDEIIAEGVISSVSLDMEPLSEKVRSVFSVVKCFFVPDESYPTDQIIKEGIYRITCINSDMTSKIDLMKYDQEVLITGQHVYGTKEEEYVDTEFETRKQVIEEIKNIVYPTVLIHNLSEIDEVKYRDIWKTNLVIIPKKINFY